MRLSLSAADAALVCARQWPIRPRAGVAQDVYAAGVIDGVDDPPVEPICRRGGARVGQEIANPPDLALTVDLEEVGAMLVVGERQEPTTRLRRARRPGS